MIKPHLSLIENVAFILDDGGTFMNRFQNFDVEALEIIRKVIIYSVKMKCFEGKELGDLKYIWAELDDELMRKNINNQYRQKNTVE